MKGSRPLTAGTNGQQVNRLLPEDRPAHEWYRFVLSFPPHLVQTYVQRFGLTARHRVLDPFCGTGTTLVACKKLGIPSVGIEANPMAHFAASVKVDWGVAPRVLLTHASKVAEAALLELDRQGIRDEMLPLLSAPTCPRASLKGLPPEAATLLLTNSISPLPLHKTLVLLDVLRARADERLLGHELLALAKALVLSISNLHFGPEVGVGVIKQDAPVVMPWLAEVQAVSGDLGDLGAHEAVEATVHLGDARQVGRILAPGSVDAVITSPPYPNEKDYTRTTRLESVLLGFIRSKADLRALKRSLVRSNTRGVYKNDDDDRWVAENPRVERLARAIEARRLELGKTSGFERMYHRVTRLYFGGMLRHFAEMRNVLRPGARLAYVVGDQASYLRVLIRTGEPLAEIAQSLGYRVGGIDLFRTRLATATREQLREEVLLLEWPGHSSKIRLARSKDISGARV